MCFPVLASCCESCTRVPIALYEKCKGFCGARENMARKELRGPEQLSRRVEPINQLLPPISNMKITQRINDETKAIKNRMDDEVKAMKNKIITLRMNEEPIGECCGLQKRCF